MAFVNALPGKLTFLTAFCPFRAALHLFCTKVGESASFGNIVVLSIDGNGSKAGGLRKGILNLLQMGHVHKIRKFHVSFPLL